MLFRKKTTQEKEQAYRNQRLQEIRNKDIALLRAERQRAEIKLVKATRRREKLSSQSYERLTPKPKHLSGMFGPPMDLGLSSPILPTKKRKDRLFDF